MLKRRTCYAALPLHALLVVLLSVWPGQAAQLPPGMHSCPSLDACLKLLNGVASTADGGIGPNEEAARGILQRFGDPAKRELLRRAAGNDAGWRNFAGAILADGWSWGPSDIPELRSALLKDPGGWSAGPLGEIGNPEAIRALVEDLPKGSDNQTDFALAQLGSRAVPFLFPLLEDKERAKSAQRVIGQMDHTALTFASRWAQCAADSSQPVRLRLAALRGIAAFGDRAKPASASLTGLLSSPDAELRAEVESTLKATRNPAVIHQVARSCRPQAGQFNSLATDALLCLREIAAYGEDGKDAGQDLLPFLSSRNGAEKEYAITTMAAIGYSPALPQIVAALSSPDWRVTYAAARSSGWLGDRQAVPELQKVASTHWLPEVRKEAKRAIAALLSPKGRLKGTWRFLPDGGPGEPFEIDLSALGETPPCAGDRWMWNGVSFVLRRPSDDSERDTSLPFHGGKLKGTNRGEWGGTLAWEGPGVHAKSEVIYQDNVVRMESDQDGAMVLFGLAHLGLIEGYVLRVSQDSDGTWYLSEVARLPGEGEALTSVAPGTFAALSQGRVVVFTRTAILGMAACDGR